MVRVLLAARATFNTQDKVSIDRLHAAQHAYHTVHIQIQFGNSPLWSAILKGHQKCMLLLVNAGANVDVQQNVSVSIDVHYRLSQVSSSPCPGEKETSVWY